MGLDRTSIHKPQFCLTGAGFHIEETTPTTIQMHQPVARALPAMRLKTLRRFQGQEYSGLLYYWFVDDQHVTSSHSERMWLMVKDLFTKDVFSVGPRYRSLHCDSRPGECLPPHGGFSNRRTGFKHDCPGFFGWGSLPIPVISRLSFISTLKDA